MKPTTKYFPYCELDIGTKKYIWYNDRSKRMNKDVKMRYIGSKKMLLPEIKRILDKHTIGTEEIFLDLFAGTNAVANFFKPYYTVYSNDLLYFNYIKSKAIIENNSYLPFNKLKSIGISNPIEHLQNLKGKNGYYTQNYSPAGDCMYLSQENTEKIDAIRETIEQWNEQKLLTEYEYFYLLNSLIEAIPYVSNITGTYGAFLKHWDKRALNPLALTEEIIFDNHRPNKAFNEDANSLVKRLKADIVYIDTPYNSRQYASNYHLLENIARHKKPKLKGVTKIFDWKNLKSDYSTKTKALHAMKDLLENIDSTHIILSYNTEGIISENDLTLLLRQYSYNGQVEVKRIPYRKYQSKQKSKNKELYELLFYIQKKPAVIKMTTRNLSKTTVVNQKKIYQKPPKLYRRQIPPLKSNSSSFSRKYQYFCRYF